MAVVVVVVGCLCGSVVGGYHCLEMSSRYASYNQRSLLRRNPSSPEKNGQI